LTILAWNCEDLTRAEKSEHASRNEAPVTYALTPQRVALGRIFLTPSITNANGTKRKKPITQFSTANDREGHS